MSTTKLQLMQSMRLLLLFYFLVFMQNLFAQNSGRSNIDTLFDKIDPQKWSEVVEKKVSNLEEKIVAKSEALLNKLQKQEEKIYKKLLTSKDSVIAKAHLEEIKNRYTSLQQKLKNPQLVNAANLRDYVPWIDATQSGLNFLERQGASGNIKDALSKVELLNSRLQQADEIKEFIRQRKQQLKNQLQNLGLVKELKKYNKQIVYYSQQVKEYKEILKDEKKIESKVIELLGRTKIFKEFIKRNSLLASLFPLPFNDVNTQNQQAGFAALQTRSQINNFIQQSGLNTSGNSTQLQQNINSVQDQITQLRNKLNNITGNASELDMPDFKYNSQKTKSFLKRIEIGTNFQTLKADRFFPATSDLAVSAGYKLNDKSILGIGVSHKLGWGSGWNNIRITHQGIGLRSFADLKLKGSFWISGGYEMNFKDEIKSIAQLRDQSAWQESGLVGLSKIISVKSKIFKKTKVQLLWDFLSYNQKPRTQAVLFRIGYCF